MRLAYALNKSLVPALNDPISSTGSSLAVRARNQISTLRPGSDYFGPNQPMVPQGPRGLLPRDRDYPMGVNLWTVPRSEQPGSASFAQLRAVADNWDLLRLVIETRKDQICEMPWTIRKQAKPGEPKHTRVGQDTGDPVIDYLSEFFKKPDRQHSWQIWLRMLLEEMFVVDALSIWPVRQKGKVVSLRIIDGATIKPLYDLQGWVPAPPDPAFQQIIKGMPAVNLTTEDLIYLPHNPRVHRYYGFSHVEQVLMTVNIGLRRQLSQLEYYTAGNIPDMLVQVPATWNTDEIRKFQSWVDESSGDTAKRRRIRLFPESKSAPTFAKEVPLKDDMDEWLARVVCYCLSVSPLPFVRMMSRASSVQANTAAAEEGKIPTLNWISDTLTSIIQEHMGFPGVEFVFNLEMESDTMKAAVIQDKKLRNGSLGIDEARAEDGKPPIGAPPMIMTASGPVLVSDVISGKFSLAKPEPESGDEGQSKEKVNAK